DDIADDEPSTPPRTEANPEHNMTKKITRRQALLGASLALLMPIRDSQGSLSTPRSSTTFAHGVASGDPDQSSVVLWTRVSGAQAPVICLWQVAADACFRHIVARGFVQTDHTIDYTVKITVEDLKPGIQYFYRFETQDSQSPTGRTRTLPAGHVESLTLAVVTCSNYTFGYFNAYEVIATDERVDLVVHLGDYIYEHGTAGYGGHVGERIGRAHEPSHEITTLADYRSRHAQYKSDICSQAMHAQHPIVVIWDDHESANNPWMKGASNHQAVDGDWATRREASLQAYYEWLPIREPQTGDTPAEYWRHYKFGDLASLITLESRHTGRSQQIAYKDHIANLQTTDQAQHFLETVVNDPRRNMLSSKMESFLATEIQESVEANRRWRLIGNPSVMAKSISPKLNEPFFGQLRTTLDSAAAGALDGLTWLGERELPGDLDTWEGYPAARERFYNIAKEAGANDLLVLSGDSHSFWANQLFDDQDSAMGLELGATGITSPRSLLALGKPGLQRFDELTAATNKEILWSDGRHRGYIHVNISHASIHADFIAVSTVESRQYSTQIIRSFDIAKSDNTLHFATKD
ncbi:MAG: alkaline phosphatase D, partial [Candidatus Azotimanducaceae bacterium]